MQVKIAPTSVLLALKMKFLANIFASQVPMSRNAGISGSLAHSVSSPSGAAQKLGMPGSTHGVEDHR